VSRAGVVAGWACVVAATVAGVGAALSATKDRYPAELTASPRLRRHASPAATGPAGPGLHPDSAALLAPFRADRQPPPRRYDPAAIVREEEARVRAAAAAALDARRPQWTLTGVLLGDPPSAVFDGLPGPDGPVAVLGVGDEVDGFRIESISDSGVVVSLEGHTWTFTVTNPWS
jgi:hypothetical protein